MSSALQIHTIRKGQVSNLFRPATKAQKSQLVTQSRCCCFQHHKHTTREQWISSGSGVRRQTITLQKKHILSSLHSTQQHSKHPRGHTTYPVHRTQSTVQSILPLAQCTAQYTVRTKYTTPSSQSTITQYTHHKYCVIVEMHIVRVFKKPPLL